MLDSFHYRCATIQSWLIGQQVGKLEKRAQKDEVIKKTPIKSQMVKNVKTGRREYTGMSATITEIWK